MKSFKFGMAVAATLLLSTAAHAYTITASTAQPQDFPTLGDFGSAASAGLVSNAPVQIAQSGVITFGAGASPMAGVYHGTTDSVAVAPTMGSGNYLAAQSSGSVFIDLGTVTQNSFSLLWGSVDSYNDLQITFSGSTPGSVTVSGNDIAQAAHISSNDLGKVAAYVTISDLQDFRYVTLSSGQAAFEFIPSVQVPEPASLALLGFGLAGIGLVRNRRAKTA